MKLHVFPPSPNARKVMTLNNLLGLDAEIVIVDLLAGDQRKPEFLKLNPNGKMPVLELDDGTALWESNAIANQMAAMGGDKGLAIFPQGDIRFDIVRWQFWEMAHWAPACAKFIGKTFFGREIDEEACTADFKQFAKVLDDHLSNRAWLCGEQMTTADISVAAMMCYRHICGMPIAGFDNVERWVGEMEKLDAWQQANPAPELAPA